MNTIDLVEDVYTRENNEFKFKIDFKNKKFSYNLKEKNLVMEDKLDCSINKEKGIILKYRLDDEEKKIIIHLL